MIKYKPPHCFIFLITFNHTILLFYTIEKIILGFDHVDLCLPQRQGQCVSCHSQNSSTTPSASGDSLMTKGKSASSDFPPTFNFLKCSQICLTVGLVHSKPTVCYRWCNDVFYISFQLKSASVGQHMKTFHCWSSDCLD